MIRVRIHGHLATYTVEDGWKCATDGLTERFLNDSCVPKQPSEKKARTLVDGQYGENATDAEPEPEAVLSYAQELQGVDKPDIEPLVDPKTVEQPSIT